MELKEEITQTIFKAIEEINKQVSRDKQLEKSTNIVIFGKEGKLDSLGFVNLIVAIEQKIEETFGNVVNLADESIMPHEENPFTTIGTLSDYIFSVLEQNNNIEA